MADYYAVLSRTLAGFGNPNIQLREKLYERARMTIQKQLESHEPKIDQDAMIAEMQKLENAINEVETQFLEGNKPQTDGETETQTDVKADVAAGAGVATGAGVAAETTAETQPEETARQSQQTTEQVTAESTTTPTTPTPPMPTETETEVYHEPKIPTGQEEPSPPAEETTEVATPVETEQVEGPAVTKTPETHQTQITQQATQQAQTIEDDDPVSRVLRQLDEVDSGGSEIPRVPEERQEQQTAQDAVEETTSKMSQADVGETQTQARFAQHAGSQPSGGGRKYLAGILVVAIIVAAAAAVYVMREPIINLVSQISGLTGDDPQQPKTVRTTTVKPEDEQTQTTQQTTQATQQTQTTQTTQATETTTQDTQATSAVGTAQTTQTTQATQATTEQKTEERLGADGQQSQQVEEIQTAEQTQQEQDDRTTKADNPFPQAFLSETRASDGTEVVSAGAAQWSAVNEPPRPEDPEEAAIRARVEIPSKNMTMIMTLKRNSYPALPASHLIELIFDPPNNSTGGSIENVNQFSLKEQRQDNGETLVAVPTKVDDGIFLLVLNNLEQARQKNENLLLSRNWLDIPVQYRNGQRAVITIEKGVEGTRVFQRVFQEWSAGG